MNDVKLSINSRKQIDAINIGLATADKFINKNYLIDLSSQRIVPLSESAKISNCIRLFKLERLVYDRKENINDKLISVYSALQNVDGSAVLLITSSGIEFSFYVGVRSEENASTASKILEKSFLGNFPGSVLSGMKNSEIADVLARVTSEDVPSKTKNISCVTVIPSMRDENKDKFVQGIEKFIDTMQGESFSALFIAKPVGKADLEHRKRGYEELFSSLSPFIKTSLSYGENYSNAVTNGMFENFSHSINQSISNTTGRNSGQHTSHTHGQNQGFNMGGGGFGYNSGTSDSSTNGYSSGTSWSKSVVEGTADTTGEGRNTSETETNGNSRTLTVEHQNKSVAVLLDKIDEQLERIKMCEAFGVWECASYFIADDIQTAVVAANTYKALMLGDDTQVENSFVNVWGLKAESEALKAAEYLRYGMHPIVEILPEQGYDSQYVTPGNYISGKELPLMMGLPHKSITGVTVSSIAEFGRNVFMQRHAERKNSIRLGQIYHMGTTENHTVDLDLDSFSSHCFITGSTGSGKSNTTYGLLEKFIQNQIPFLVIEPAKGEYKEAFGGVPNINIFTTNPLIGQMLKLNPFKFDPKIHILEHLDRLIEIFNACWEMYAAMPAILKEAVEKMYVRKGWDLLNSQYIGDGEPTYPTFTDLMKTLPEVINTSSYSSDTKGDYTGALVTRVNSLTNGISGQIFCDSYEIADKTLFDENTIVDLSRVGSTETKSLIMGVLILKLSEFRMATATQANSRLRHITVLEEAHNLLKKTTPSTAGSNVIGKSVEMICNNIAEMRTYGEGFIIVDQSPTAVDISAIKNTNTKIIMRLPERGDCEAVGAAVGLNEEQIREIAKLGTGIAVVMQNNWLEAVLTHIDVSSNMYARKLSEASYDALRKLRGIVIQELMQQYIVDKEMQLQNILTKIDSFEIESYKKAELKCCVECAVQHLQKGRDIEYFCNLLLNLSGAKNLFGVLEDEILPNANVDEMIYDSNSVLRWKAMFRRELSKFVELPDNFNNTIVKYLLHTQETNKGAVDYLAVTQILYPRSK